MTLPIDKKIQITRVGAYGVAIENEKILLIRQNAGYYKGQLDLPGGGIEFGESMEETLRREFVEEVVMTFDFHTLLDNLTTVTDNPKNSSNEPHTFYRVGMIYRIYGLQPIKDATVPELEYAWVDPKTVFEDECSPLLWLLLTKLKAKGNAYENF